MTDHVSNLRSNALEWEDSQCPQRSKWAREAADEIERLQAENTYLRTILKSYGNNEGNR